MATQRARRESQRGQPGQARPRSGPRQGGPAGWLRGAAGRLRLSRGWLLAGAGYLALAVAMWWHAWTSAPAHALTCGCGDPASFVWYLAYPAYAISHGHSLFFTAAVHPPAGMNLLDNTSVLALGVLLAPVTWLAGPVASLNVALTAAPALTALSAYGCLRRGLGLRPAACFLAGLLFGFSPFVLRNEAMAHLQVTFLALVPLIFWCCYELAVRQRGTWRRWGLALAGLVIAQFFVGTEILTVTALTVAGCLALAALAVLRRPGALAARFPFAWRGFGLAAAVAVAALAYPLWFAMAGPGHFRGSIWASPVSNGLIKVLLPVGSSDALKLSWRVAGYLGPIGTDKGYLGIPALAVLAAAVLLVRRPLAKLAAVAAVAAVWLSLGARLIPVANGGEPSWVWQPWRLFHRLPILQQLAPANFTVPAVWFIAVAAALLAHQLIPARPQGQAAPEGAPAAVPAAPRAARAALAAAAAAVLVLPWALAWPLPYTTRVVSPPAWIRQDSGRLPAGSVVLFYPFPATYQDQALLWQAANGMKYALVGGRGIVASGSGAADHGWTPGTPEGTLSALTTRYVVGGFLARPPVPGPARARSFRDALRHWGVTDVVMLAGGRDPRYARRWLTAALGASPHAESGAWVWHGVRSLPS